jgi:hypothetical protein
MFGAHTDIAFGDKPSGDERERAELSNGSDCPHPRTHHQENPMNKLLYATMAFAVLGLAAGPNVAVAAQKNGVNNNTSYECFTDDGYGRKLPCSYSYQKRAEQKNYDCFTDDGYGRRLPCSYSIKRR